MISIGARRLYLAYKVGKRMSSTKYFYEEAVHKLNLLQSNKSTIDQIRRDIKTGQKCTNLEDMEHYLLRTGVTLSMLDELSVIHVAGTKGKGSTSAMCESILRTHGFRTGFYSSPHLVAVRERIRLGGQVLSEEQFADHFYQVYNALYDTQSFEGDMPKYFAFLTVLAFNVFLKEKVDVAIVEVGIGGIVDYTNVLRKVPVVGITALGLDHTSILGNTLPEIAAAKAGIMKPGCLAYTVHQPPDAMKVLRNYANNVKCSLTVVPEYNSYKFENGLKHSIALEAYRVNASLAVQLSHAWMTLAKKNKVQSTNIKKRVSGIIPTNGYSEIDTFVKDIEKDDALLVNILTNEMVRGLRDCQWPGRYQVIQSQYATFYLDGAHTKESIEMCARWFESYNSNNDKILIFSATGDRNAEILLRPLSEVGFRSIFFVIPNAYKDTTKKDDNFSLLEHKELLSRCENHARIWNSFKENRTNLFVMECVADAITNIQRENPKTSVLVTGSLHLVGATLSIINPHMYRT